MGSEREHVRARERVEDHAQTNHRTKRHIDPLPSGRYSLFIFNRITDREYTFIRTGVSRRDAENWLNDVEQPRSSTETRADRIKASGRTQPLTPVEQAFFGAPDHMVKPRPETGRTPINIEPSVAERLRKSLIHDPRFHTMGYSEFIARTLDALECE